jgi:VanZ family protein
VIRLIIWLPPLVWMAVILSLAGTTFSDAATGSVIRPLLKSVLPWASATTVDAVHWLIRKWAHLTEYFVLATLWFIALARSAHLPRRRAAWLAFVIAVGWAVVDELYQATTVSRSGSAGDVGIDATGALVASFFTGFGWRDAVAYLTTALLWLAAVGGAALIAVNLSTGVPSGVLWVTVPAAIALLVWQRRRQAARPPDPQRV